MGDQLPPGTQAHGLQHVGPGLTKMLSRGEKDSVRTWVSPAGSLLMGVSRMKGPLGFSTENSTCGPGVKERWQEQGCSPPPPPQLLPPTPASHLGPRELPGLGVDKDTVRSSGEMFWMETFFMPRCPEIGWWSQRPGDGGWEPRPGPPGAGVCRGGGLGPTGAHLQRCHRS